jgi:hypothetical protein
MNRQRLIGLGISVVLCIVMASCASTPVTFKSMMDEKYDATKGRTITGSACGFQLLLFIPIMVNQRAEMAYDGLMKQAGNDYVTDIKVRERWTYAFIGTVYCTDLEATAYPRLAVISAPSGTVTQ